MYSQNGSVADYHSATGLEALFGYLQINKEFDRINQLFEIIIHTRFGSDFMQTNLKPNSRLAKAGTLFLIIL